MLHTPHLPESYWVLTANSKALVSKLQNSQIYKKSKASRSSRR